MEIREVEADLVFSYDNKSSRGFSGGHAVPGLHGTVREQRISDDKRGQI